MANAYLLNQALSANNHSFSAVWGVTRAMKKAGCEYLASGNGSTKDTSGNPANDLWGGNADPALDTYPTALDTVSAWWLGRLVSTWKIPVGASAGFLRGEGVTQSVSGATGEILGLMYDSTTPANSYLVVIVRTGTFDGTNLITGALSAATITPTGAPVEYQGQVVFWKSTDTVNGTIYYMRGTTGEGQFSTLTGTAGCTATVAPGGGGTGNGFPTFAYAPRGTGGAATHASWVFTTTPGNGKYQAVAANMTPGAGVTPDCTFWLMLGLPGLGATANGGFGFFRVDDHEDGDLDPFVWYSPSTTVSRTAATGTNSLASWSDSGVIYNASSLYYGGWRRRAFASADAWQRYWPCQLCFRVQSTSYVFSDNFATVDTVASATDTQKVREPLWLAVVGTTKQRKGTLRWMQLVPTGAAYEDWDTKSFIQVFTATSTFAGVVLGPWDGSTTPLQA